MDTEEKCERVQNVTEGDTSNYTSRVVLGQNLTCDSWFAGGMCFDPKSGECRYGIYYRLFSDSESRECLDTCPNSRVSSLGLKNYLLLECVQDWSQIYGYSY